MKYYSKAHAILNKINLGWNLGNYLDAHDKKYVIGTNKNKSIKEVVNLWNNQIFNLKCFDTLKKHGINCVRIPVTWYNFILIKKNKISISKEVFDHLKEIINYALLNDFIIVLDMHHDDQTWLSVSGTNKEFDRVKKQYEKIWKIIAYEFKDYDKRLIFEGMNEIIDRSNPEKYDWWGHDKTFFKRLYVLYKLFIKSVRRFSKNNKFRTLMISTYGAQIHRHALKYFKMCKDSNIIVDLHYYSKHISVEDLENDFAQTFEYLKKKDIPFFMGEIGMKKELIDNKSAFKTYISFLNSHKIKYALWDNGSSRKFIDRETAQFIHL